MSTSGEKKEAGDRHHERGSSSASNSPLNPKATEFGSTRPTEQQAKPDNQEYSWQYAQGQEQHRMAPAGQAVRGRSGRGRGRGQRTTYPLPQPPPGLGRPGQQYQLPQMMPWVAPPFPPMPSLGSGEGYQPMFPMAQYPPHGSTPMGATSIPQLTPFYGGQQPQYQSPSQLPMNHSHGTHLSQNEIGTPPQQLGARTPTQASGSGNSRSREVSGSSRARSSPYQAQHSETREDKISIYRRDFETARSFEDDHIYFPKGNTMCKK